MLRRIKTHVNYKKDGVVIRPATLHEEYDIGNWTTYYDWIKLGYEYSEYESLYSDIMYVMTINGSLIGYFLAYNSINIGDNPNIPLYNKEMVVYDLVVDVRAYAKYTKILIDYIIKYSNYNGYKAVVFYKVDKCNKFTNFLNKNYYVTEIEKKLYLYNENPRIRTCQKYLTIYKEDKLSLEDLYFLYDLRFDVLKTKCKFSFNEYQIVVDRLTGIIEFPSNVKVINDTVRLNNKTKDIIDILITMFDGNNVKDIIVDYDSNNPYYYEAIVDGLLHVSKTFKEIENDKEYINELKSRGYKEVLPSSLRYDMNGGSLHYASAIYKL